MRDSEEDEQSLQQMRPVCQERAVPPLLTHTSRCLRPRRTPIVEGAHDPTRNSNMKRRRHTKHSSPLAVRAALDDAQVVSKKQRRLEHDLRKMRDAIVIVDDRAVEDVDRIRRLATLKTAGILCAVARPDNQEVFHDTLISLLNYWTDSDKLAEVVIDLMNDVEFRRIVWEYSTYLVNGTANIETDGDAEELLRVLVQAFRANGHA